MCSSDLYLPVGDEHLWHGSSIPTVHEDSDDAEYNDEAGMFKNNLQTIQRVSTHLEKEIYDNENLPEWCQEKIAQAKGMIVSVMDYMISQHENGIVDTIDEDWQKVNKKDRTAGMSKKAVKAYRREHPGSKLQTAVTTKPSKLKKGSKASKRRKSFCARSLGQKKMHNIDCSKTPDKAICAARRRWNCEESIAEGAMKDLHTELADKYRELAPKIEKYKDSYLAGQLYDALEAIAIEHGAELEFKRMLAGARNSAHMDYDTNPGGFQNWFWYLPFANDRDVAEGVEDYAGLYSPEAIALGKKFCDFYNITEDTDVQLAIEIIDSYLDEFKHTGQPIDLRVIKSGVVDAFRQVYRGMGPGPNFRKKFQNRLDEKNVEEGLKDPKDNPCWKGYKPVGTKQKGGRTVPNCVPKE